MRVNRRARPGAMALLAGLLSATAADAAKLRRPFDLAVGVNEYFDHGGVKDYACGGRSYAGHTGTDFPVPVGTPVLAAADGVVNEVHDGCPNYGSISDTCGNSCGNHVQIDHGDGTVTTYCHLQQGSLAVGLGAQVSCGQPIGRSASSGMSTGPHLHLRLTVNGVRKDPFAGPCSDAPGSYWQDQGSYPGNLPAAICGDADALIGGQSWIAPARTTDIDGDGRADVCGRGAAGFWCHLSRGSAWEQATAPLGLSDADGWDDQAHYGTLRMGDIDGDRRADLCARAAAGMRCWRSDGAVLSGPIVGPEWSNEKGWKQVQYYSTIRLLDFDGDGKDDLCARAAAGIVCHPSQGSSFGQAVVGPAWSDAAGLDDAKYYATLRVGDVDGDHRVDLCMRVKTGMECFLSDGKGFATRVAGPEWSDASGWGAAQYWTTIRLADVDGDGRADLCARAGAGLRCHFSSGSSFGDPVEVAPLSDETGWNDPSNFRSLRVGDIDGDGAQDLCVRSNAAVLCYRWDGAAFGRVDGPAWSDADGWTASKYLDTVQLGDFNGDGKADLCARTSDGWRCHASTGSGFGEALALGEFSDAKGWSKVQYYSTIFFGGPARAGNDGGPLLADGGAGPSSDARASADGGPGGPDGQIDPDEPRIRPTDGCACAVSGPDRSPGALWAMVITAAVALARRRKQRSAPWRGFNRAKLSSVARQDPSHGAAHVG